MQHNGRCPCGAPSYYIGQMAVYEPRCLKCQTEYTRRVREQEYRAEEGAFVRGGRK